MSVFEFILGSLACYRVTVLFARDEGPFKVFKKLRGAPYIGLMTGCPFCVSIWLGVGLETAFYFSGVHDSVVVSACIALGFSAMSIILDKCFSADHQT